MALRQRLANGATPAQLAGELAARSGWPRRKVYQLLMEIQAAEEAVLTTRRKTMNLDDTATFTRLDAENMLAEIDALPGTTAKAWELGRRHALPEWTDLQQIVICGMGGSAIGADLLAAYTLDRCRVPIYRPPRL